MRASRWAVIAMIIASWGGAGSAWAQEVYASPGRWVDDHSRAFALGSLSGEYTVATMAYGACRRVCSSTLRVMEQVQALADARHLRVNFLVVGLDPSEDTPQDWAAFRAFRKLTRPNWQFLTGDEAATHQIAQRLGVKYWHYGEHTMHDFRIVLLSPTGNVVRAIGSFDEDVSKLLP